MAEEGKILEDRTREDVAEIKADLRQVKEGQNALAQRLSRLEGLFEQLSQRVGNLEQNQRQMMAILVGTWITTMLAIVGLYFKG